jgi:glycosyltransferase involved in cell wall biosynthesis
MLKYDALILPTHYQGEGYPGVIIEAYCIGMPVICTNWQSLPEIVDVSSGILINPKDSESLYRAMQFLIENPTYYQRICKGAKDKAKLFYTEEWVEEFVSLCQKLHHDI